MFGAGPAAPFDPTGVEDYDDGPFPSGSGKTILNDTVLPDDDTIHVYIVAGQSLVCNTGDATTYTVLNPTAVQQLDIRTGLFYRAADPLMGLGGTSGNTWMPRLGDLLIEDDLASRVIFLPIGVSGTGSGDWRATGRWNHKIRAAMWYLRLLGWPLTAFLWQQGQKDGADALSQATCEANLRAIFDTIRGFNATVPILVAQDSMRLNATVANVRNAQAAVVDNPNGIYAGPDIDTLTGGTNRYDGSHMTNTGNVNSAALWKAAIEAVI